MNDDIEGLGRELEQLIGSFGSVVVGFSAGVDSSVVAAAAHAALGEHAVAVTAATETITPEDMELASGIAAMLGMRHQTISYNELEIPGYAANPANRCYFCKDALYTRLLGFAREHGLAVVLDGANADDARDYRPGRQAAREQGVRSPLLELAIDKTMVRQLAGHYGLANHDKPSAPCLSSRVPYGIEITRDLLLRIERAERGLRALGFRELRVRHHGDLARVEIPRDEFPMAIAIAGRIDQVLREAGYSYGALDLRGFRSGSLNEVLTQIELPSL